MKMLLASVFTTALLALTPPASAMLISFNASLSGSQQVPPNTSPGTGSATLVADTVNKTLTVSEIFAGLLSPSVAGHLHVGSPGNNGSIILEFNGFPMGTSGTFNGTFTEANLVNQATTGISTFSGLLGVLENNNAYVNIHSVLLTKGEIRGAVLAVPSRVPEPMTLALLAVGLAVVAVARRRLS